MEFFTLKEIKNTNKALKLVTFLMLGITVFFKCALYNFYGLSSYLNVKSLVDRIPYFDDFLYPEVLFCFERAVMGVFHLGMFLFIAYESLNQEHKFERVLEKITAKLSSGGISGDEFKSENVSLQKKYDKLSKMKARAIRVTYIFVLFSLAYLGSIYYEIY